MRKTTLKCLKNERKNLFDVSLKCHRFDKFENKQNDILLFVKTAICDMFFFHFRFWFIIRGNKIFVPYNPFFLYIENNLFPIYFPKGFEE